MRWVWRDGQGEMLLLASGNGTDWLRLKTRCFALDDSVWRYPDQDLPLSSRGATALSHLIPSLIPFDHIQLWNVTWQYCQSFEVSSDPAFVSVVGELCRILLQKITSQALGWPLQRHPSPLRIPIWSMTCTFAPSASTSASRPSASLWLCVGGQKRLKASEIYVISGNSYHLRYQNVDIYERPLSLTWRILWIGRNGSKRMTPPSHQLDADHGDPVQWADLCGRQACGDPWWVSSKFD